MQPTDVRTAILATVTYADLFDFPLTSAEIHRFLIGVEASGDAIRSILDQMVIHGDLLATCGYFMLPNRAQLVGVRQQRAIHAEYLWQSAEKYAKWISRLPFVRMVAVTGSLAVDNPTSDADIDYLIITAHRRLWLCRLFVIGIVYLAAREGIEVCPNYFLSEQALALDEQDIYTGRELMQMRPLFGKQAYCRMVTANAWVETLLPNSRRFAPESLPLDEDQFRPKRWFERALNGRIGHWLEQWEQKRKIKRFSTASAHISEAQFSPDRCKGHITAHGAATKQRFEKNQPHPIEAN